MSYTKPLAERERALEDAFFRKESERLLAAMRERKSHEAQKEALSEVLGLRDERIIEPLLDLGIREENVTALVMAPLVAVAWADRTLDNEERYTLLEAENDLGIDPKSAAGELLAVWLSHRPHENLIDAWAAYVVHRQGPQASGCPPDARRFVRLGCGWIARAHSSSSSDSGPWGGRSTSSRASDSA